MKKIIALLLSMLLLLAAGKNAADGSVTVVKTVNGADFFEFYEGGYTDNIYSLF